MYQLSPSDLLAVKDYLTDLLKGKKIRCSKSALRASLVPVKDKRKLRAVVDYRELNRMKTRNLDPFPLPDELLGQLGHVNIFSTLHFKTRFHQLRFKPDDAEKKHLIQNMINLNKL